MKKAISVLLISMLFMMNFTSVFAVDDTGKYDQYLPKVKSAIEKMTPEQIETLTQRVNAALITTTNPETQIFLENVKTLLIEPELEELFQDIMSDMLNIEEPITQIEAPVYQELSSSQERIIAREIMNMQNDFKSETQSLLSQMEYND